MDNFKLLITDSFFVRVGDIRGARMVLAGRPEEKRPFGICRCRWDNNIKMDLQEVGCEALTGLIWLSTETGGRHL
jgi:hypothetical protein